MTGAGETSSGRARMDQFVPTGAYGKRAVARAAAHGFSVLGPNSCIKHLVRDDVIVGSFPSCFAIERWLDAYEVAAVARPDKEKT